MATLRAGDVVTVDFAGANATKRRPMVVLSGSQYHAERPDVIVSVLTSNLATATSQFDCRLNDWAQAGLRLPSAFRCYFGMAGKKDVRRIGRLTDADWQLVCDCVERAMT